MAYAVYCNQADTGNCEEKIRCPTLADAQTAAALYVQMYPTTVGSVDIVACVDAETDSSTTIVQTIRTRPVNPGNHLDEERNDNGDDDDDDYNGKGSSRSSSSGSLYTRDTLSLHASTSSSSSSSRINRISSSVGGEEGDDDGDEDEGDEKEKKEGGRGVADGGQKKRRRCNLYAEEVLRPPPWLEKYGVDWNPILAALVTVHKSGIYNMVTQFHMACVSAQCLLAVWGLYEHVQTLVDGDASEVWDRYEAVFADSGGGGGGGGGTARVEALLRLADTLLLETVCAPCAPAAAVAAAAVVDAKTSGDNADDERIETEKNVNAAHGAIIEKEKSKAAPPVDSRDRSRCFEHELVLRAETVCYLRGCQARDEDRIISEIVDATTLRSMGARLAQTTII